MQTTKYKIFRYIFAAELLLILAGLIGITRFNLFNDSGLFILSAFLFISGIILLISALLVYLFLKGYKASFWAFLVIIGMIAIGIYTYESITTDSDSYDFTGTLEDAIPYAERILPLLDDHKNATGEYPYNLDYLDVNFNNLLSPLTIHSDKPRGLYVSTKWIGYYPITKNEFALCIEEHDKMNNYYSSIMYSNRNEQWKQSDCSVYHERNKHQTSGIERDAIVTNKDVFSRKLTQYRVEFQNGETLSVLSLWSDFRIGECVKIYIPDDFSPRIAMGNDCGQN